MKKFVMLVVMLVLMACMGEARGKLSGWCQDGGYTVSIPGTQGSSARFQRSFPSCTVTVYLSGTVTLASIYADDSGTVKANPFTAAATGQWFVYADDGTYDVRFSAGGISTPFTLGDQQLLDADFYKNLWVNPLNYGCKADGVTDDSTCLQNAINAAQNGNGKLYLPVGVYAFSTTLNINSVTGIIIQGHWERAYGTGTAAKGTKLKYTGNGTAINISRGAPNYIYSVHLRNLMVMSSQGRAVAQKGISVYRCSECYFDNVYVGDGNALASGFATAWYLDGIGQVVWMNPTTSRNGIGFDFDYTAGSPGNASVTIVGGNIFDNSTAAFRLGYVLNLEVLGVWAEWAQDMILIDDSTAATAASVTNVAFRGGRFVTGPTSDYLNATFLNVKTAGGAVVIDNLIFDNVAASMLCGSPLCANPPTRAASITAGTGDIYFHKSTLTGGTTSGVNITTSNVNVFADFSTAVNNLGVAVPFFAGAGTSNNITSLSSGTVVYEKTGAPLAVAGRTGVGNRTAWYEWYKGGVAAGRSGYIGFPYDLNDNMSIVNDTNGASINLTPTAGTVESYGTLTRVKRLSVSLGTAVDGGDIALSAGWGDTATVDAIAGKDSTFTFRVNCAGAGIGASPTITITFPDGNWPASGPVPIVTRSAGDQMTVANSYSCAVGSCTITFLGTPVSGEKFVYNVMLVGIN